MLWTTASTLVDPVEAAIVNNGDVQTKRLRGDVWFGRLGGGENEREEKKGKKPFWLFDV